MLKIYDKISVQLNYEQLLKIVFHEVYPPNVYLTRCFVVANVLEFDKKKSKNSKLLELRLEVFSLPDKHATKR